MMLKRVVPIGCLLGIVLVITWLVARERLVASTGYRVYDTFESMPVDDSALEAWLILQPGIVASHLSREENRLTIDFIQVRNLAGHPPIPDLEGAAQSLGYQGGHGFRESR